MFLGQTGFPAWRQLDAVCFKSPARTIRPSVEPTGEMLAFRSALLNALGKAPPCGGALMSRPDRFRDPSRLDGEGTAERHGLSPGEHPSHYRNMLPNAGILPPALPHVLAVVPIEAHGRRERRGRSRFGVDPGEVDDPVPGIISFRLRGASDAPRWIERWGSRPFRPGSGCPASPEISAPLGCPRPERWPMP